MDFNNKSLQHCVLQMQGANLAPTCDDSDAPESILDDPTSTQSQPDVPASSEHLDTRRLHHTNRPEPSRQPEVPCLENRTLAPPSSASSPSGAPEANLYTQHKTHQLISLPAKLGGLGILSMLECAPHAFAAASEASDRILHPLLLRRPSEQPRDDAPTQDMTSIRSQRERCTQAFEARYNHLVSTLPPLEVQAIQESATYVGRRWLGIIPFHPSLKLSDFKLLAALHHCTLSPSRRTHCQHCGIRNEIMHDEVCPASPSGA
jgi:hypothetical protein